MVLNPIFHPFQGHKMRCFNKILLIVFSILLCNVFSASDSAVSNTFSLGITEINNEQAVVKILENVTFSMRTSGEILVVLNNQLQNNDKAVARVYDLKGVLLNSVEFGKDNTAVLRVKEYSMGMYLMELNLFSAKFRKKLLIIK